MSLNSAIWLSLVSILATGLVVTLLAYIYATWIYSKRKRIGTKVSLQPNYRVLTSLEEVQEVQSDGVLSTSSTVIGVIKLELFARRIKPDYIVGVNRGGWLLSTYLAHRLNIGRDNLLRFDADRDCIIDTELSHNINDADEMNLLLVDDISRTGESIKKAISYLKNKFILGKINIAVLVVCGRKADKSIDYNPYWTRDKDIQLPWSSDERKREARQNVNAQGKVVQLGDENSLTMQAPVLRIADSKTKEGEGVDISTSDIEIIINLLEKVYSLSETTTLEKFSSQH
jgi:hypoxanthine phosphoribosyltransferase